MEGMPELPPKFYDVPNYSGQGTPWNELLSLAI
jgi:hypothetical protein